ncbi:hypothetical protein ACWKWU_00625 [Chitinophaga lutea]
MRTDRHIFQRVLLVFLFFLLQCLAAFVPGISSSMEAKACVKGDQVRAMRLHTPDSLSIPFKLMAMDTEDDFAAIRNAQNRRRLRFLQSTPSQQFNLSPRVSYCQHDQQTAVLTDENKAGVYERQDSFLPAYYRFLFRYTLF